MRQKSITRFALRNKINRKRKERKNCIYTVEVLVTMEIIVQFLEYHRFSARLLSQIVLDGKKKKNRSPTL